jgi:hypothetical protein
MVRSKDEEKDEENRKGIKRGRTQSLLTGFNFGGSTKGLLGGWLARRLAASRGVMAAGARLAFCIFRACRLALEHFMCQRKLFLESGSDWI